MDDDAPDILAQIDEAVDDYVTWAGSSDAMRVHYDEDGTPHTSSVWDGVLYAQHDAMLTLYRPRFVDGGISLDEQQVAARIRRWEHDASTCEICADEDTLQAGPRPLLFSPLTPGQERVVTYYARRSRFDGMTTITGRLLPPATS